MGQITRATTIAAVVFAASVLSPAAQGSAVSIAVMRPDGIMVPIAMFDGTSWSNPWPEPQTELTGDQSIEAMTSNWLSRRKRNPEVWRVWRAEGSEPLEAHVLRHVIFDDHCLHQIGLLTDLRLPPYQAENTEPQPKFLALDAAHRVEQPIDLRTMPEAESRWKDLIDAILAGFPKEEERAVADWERHGDRATPLSREARLKRPIQLRRLYADQSGPQRSLYFEGIRDYGAPVHGFPNACNARTQISGWTYADGNAPAVLAGARAVITDCDEKEAARLRPLGIIELGADRVWVVQELGYEGEAYAVVSVKSAVRRLLETQGGGCQPLPELKLRPTVTPIAAPSAAADAARRVRRVW